MNKTPMKYITFAIMAALILGVAASPAFSNAFADEPVEAPEYTEKELKEQRSDESKQAKSDQRSISEEKKQISAEKQREYHKAKRLASEERRLERSAEFNEERQQLQKRFADLPEEKQQALQSKLAAMREHRSSMDDDNPSRPDFRNMTEEERKEAVANIVESRRDARNAAVTNMNQVEKIEFLAELKQKRFNDSQFSVSPVNQLSLGLDPNEIICAEGKELVIRVSNGSPMCMGYNSVVILMDRGTVTYPE